MNDKSVLNKDKTGFKIKALMDKHKVNHEQLAHFIGLKSSRVIFEWVNGTKIPKTENLIKLSIIFNVKMEDILVIEYVFSFMNCEYIVF